jgi:hypothetical protein
MVVCASNRAELAIVYKYRIRVVGNGLYNGVHGVDDWQEIS